MEQGNSILKGSSGRRAERIVTFAVIPILLIASLLLPPARVVSRISDIGWTAIKYDGGALQDPDGTVITFPAGLAGKTLKARFSSVPRDKFLAGDAGDELAAAASAIPQAILPRSPVYQLQLKQDASVPVNLSVPIPNDSEPVQSLDLYEWTGEAWRWLPSAVHPDADVITAELAETPGPFLVALAQPSAKQADVVSGSSAAVGISSAAPGNAVTPSLDGSLAPVMVPGADSISASAWPFMPLLTNAGANGQPDVAALNAILADESSMAKHIQAIVKWVADGGLKGITLDYQGVDAGLTSRFTDFVADLSSALHSAGAQLAVRIATPSLSGDAWDSAAYDWAALGQNADAIRFAAPADPRECVAGGALDKLLSWAVSQAPRQKLAAEFSAMSLDVSDNGAQLLPVSDALSPLSQMDVAGDKVEILPGQVVTLTAGLAPEAALLLDEATGAYQYTYSDAQGAKHTVWIDDGANLARKLQVLEPYRLGGVFLTGITGDPVEGRLEAALDQYRANQAASVQPSDFTLVWSVQSGSNPAVEATRALKDGAYTFSAAEPGEYFVASGLSLDGGRTISGLSDHVSLLVVTPTPTPTPTPLPTATPTPKPTPKPAAVTSSKWLKGPHLGYGFRAHLWGEDHGRILGLIKQAGFNWVEQQVVWSWIESSDNNYDWGELDHIVNSCEAAGVNLVLGIVQAPGWASLPGLHIPKDPAYLGDILYQMASRYKGRVRAYEIWNETNVADEVGFGNFNPGQFAEWLKAGYQGVKRGDPAAIVVAGALTPTGVGRDSGVGWDDVQYMQALYAYQGGMVKNYFDVWGVHANMTNNPPDDDASHNSTATNLEGYTASYKGHGSFYFKRFEEHRAIMVANGDGGKQIWFTEFGWPSSPTPHERYAAAKDNTEEEQARYLVRAFEIAKQYPYIGVMMVWNLNYGPLADAEDSLGKYAYSVLNRDWNPRPSYWALANMPK